MPHARPDPDPDPDPDRGPDPDHGPVLPSQSLDDTDIGWGEQPESDDDERLRQERPPHWDAR